MSEKEQCEVLNDNESLKAALNISGYEWDEDAKECVSIAEEVQSLDLSNIHYFLEEKSEQRSLPPRAADDDTRVLDTVFVSAPAKKTYPDFTLPDFSNDLTNARGEIEIPLGENWTAVPSLNLPRFFGEVSGVGGVCSNLDQGGVEGNLNVITGIFAGPDQLFNGCGTPDRSAKLQKDMDPVEIMNAGQTAGASPLLLPGVSTGDTPSAGDYDNIGKICRDTMVGRACVGAGAYEFDNGLGPLGMFELKYQLGANGRGVE